MKKRLLAGLLALCMLLGLAACGSNTTAATMRLMRTEGQVYVSDDDGAEVTVRESLSLFSGYGVDTRRESFAWINLDDTKLTKMDEKSEIEITKKGRELEIELVSGSLFFHVTEPLEDDETLNISTSTMVVGIRGTCGWVTEDTACLLEGKVSVTAGDQSVTVTAGEMAVMTEDGTLEVKQLSREDVPSFVLEEVEDDRKLMRAVSGGGTPDEPGSPSGTPDGPASPSTGLAPWQESYISLLDLIKDTAKWYYLYDIDKDGTPELIASYYITSRDEAGSQIQVYTFRGGRVEALVDDSGSDTIEFPFDGMRSYPEGNGVLFTSGTFRGLFTLSILRMDGLRMSIEELGKYGEDHIYGNSIYDYSPGTDGISWMGPNQPDLILNYTVPETAGTAPGGTPDGPGSETPPEEPGRPGDEPPEGNVTWSLEDGVLTISGTGDMDNYTNYADNPTMPWSRDLSQVRSIVIEPGVTSIGDYAFYGCFNLTSVTIPDGVTSVGDWAFWYCNNLTTVSIPDTVTSIGDSAFSNCHNLTGVKLPSGLAFLGSMAFSNCSGLTEMTIPDGVTWIGNSAFSACSGLTSVTIPGSVTSIENSTFAGCSSLTGVTIPGGVTSIEDSAFSGCHGLTEVTIPDSVTSIGDGAFSGCDALTSITIPNGVTSIGQSAFYNCTALTSVTIPSSVTHIGHSAFSGCDALTEVYFPGNPDPFNSIQIDLRNDVLQEHYIP